ncbi:amino acid ABC transporter substrate-binding protein [Bacillus pumilus]|uniref:amino acid ABC transporter substrate-binding protein n=1 Tax=Bacillus pumilus TaxID=1408 RepID=UPI0010BE6C83|nr:amino acid ABC transporter substrate-binding protein [Bacillus pumilus]TKI23372.1 amino acid ABC transporter substrate-binding protein [Bacillus pumilus]
MKQKTAFMMSGVLLLFLSLMGCSSVKTTTDDGRKIVKIALSAEVNPPFLATNERNEPIGYNIDYLNEVEKRLPHVHFDYIFGEEESNLIGVGAGKFEMAANWFFSNPEREKRFLYPKIPYGYSMTGLIVNESDKEIRSLDDMTSKKLAPVSPSGGLRSILNQYNQEHDPDIPLTTIESPSNELNLKRVESGRSDAAFMNISTFDTIQKHLNLKVKVGGIVSKEPIFLVLQPSEKQLAADLDRITQEMIDDGTLPKLAKKWFGIDFFQDIDDISEQGDQNEGRNEAS